MDLSPFTRAGLKLKEIGHICGVSHTTAGLWMRGKRDVHHLLEDKVARTLVVVDKAVTSGDLPLSAATPREDRLDQIIDIISMYR